MKISKKLLMLGLATVSSIAITTTVVSCQSESSTKSYKELSNKEFDELIKTRKLTSDQITYQINSIFNKNNIGLVTMAKVTHFLTQVKASNKFNDVEFSKIVEKVSPQAGQFGSYLWNMFSPEAKIAKEQSYALAKAAFDKITQDSTNNLDLNAAKADGSVSDPASGKFVPVVFMDIDETVLQNTLTEAIIMMGGSISEKDFFDIDGNRDQIPGAIDFIRYVHQNGGIVLYNSDMKQTTPIITGVKKNLKKLGLEDTYIKDWQFWMKGSAIFNSEGKFNSKPWEADKSKSYSKNVRMNAVSDNVEGWNLKQSDATSGEHVKMRVIMKIGDSYSDFVDEAYKYGKTNEQRIKFYDREKFHKLFTNINGSTGLRYEAIKKADATTEFEKEFFVREKELEWKQFYVLTPANAMYGHWMDEYGRGQFSSEFEKILQIYEKAKELKNKK